MSATVTNGIDVSNYQGPLDPAILASAKDRYDLSFFIAGTQDPDITQEQLNNAAAAGFTDRALYVFMGLEANNPARVRIALNLARTNNLSRIALDAERSDLDGTRPTWLQVVTCANMLAAEGFTPEVYTNPDTYEAYGSPPIPDGWVIWLANHVYRTPVPASEWADKAPGGMDFVNAPEWMGASARVLLARANTWQWQGTTDLGGFSADLNVRLNAGVDTNPQEPTTPVVIDPPDPTQVPPLPDAGELPVDPRVWIFNLTDAHGFRGMALNGPVLEIYNGPSTPVFRWGSEDGAYPGQLSKLFGDHYEWLVAAESPDSNDGGYAARWIKTEGD